MLNDHISLQSKLPHAWWLETTNIWGRLGGSAVKHLPLAQVVIPGSWDTVPHRAPHREPASPSAYVSGSLSLCLS